VSPRGRSAGTGKQAAALGAGEDRSGAAYRAVFGLALSDLYPEFVKKGREEDAARGLTAP
jgi:hypothetical protein